MLFKHSCYLFLDKDVYPCIFFFNELLFVIKLGKHIKVLTGGDCPQIKNISYIIYKIRCFF